MMIVSFLFLARCETFLKSCKHLSCVHKIDTAANIQGLLIVRTKVRRAHLCDYVEYLGTQDSHDQFGLVRIDGQEV